MKKNFLHLFSVVMMLFAATTVFTSCEDENIAYTLEGTWEGNMYAEYEWNGSWYETSSTQVTFMRNPYKYTSGAGYWVDYFRGNTPWHSNYYANHMSWRVRDGIIFIYLEEDDVEMQIRNYRLNDDYFSGEVYASDGSWREFRLRHVSSPNWNDYTWGGNDYYYDYYFARSRATGETPDSTATVPHPKRIIRGK